MIGVLFLCVGGAADWNCCVKAMGIGCCIYCDHNIQSRAVGIWMDVPVVATPPHSNIARALGLISSWRGNSCLVFDMWGAVVFGHGTRRFH